VDLCGSPEALESFTTIVSVDSAAPGTLSLASLMHGRPVLVSHLHADTVVLYWDLLKRELRELVRDDIDNALAHS
jgi:hypothetical protein